MDELAAEPAHARVTLVARERTKMSAWSTSGGTIGSRLVLVPFVVELEESSRLLRRGTLGYRASLARGAAEDGLPKRRAAAKPRQAMPLGDNILNKKLPSLLRWRANSEEKEKAGSQK